MVKKKDIYIAIIISLVVNIVVLFSINESVQLGGFKPKEIPPDYIELDLVEIEETAPSSENDMQERLETQLNNLIANRTAELSNEKTSYSQGQKDMMNQDVEDLVAEIEAKLKAEAEKNGQEYVYDKPKEVDDFNKDGSNSKNNTSYKGTVAVSYNLPNPNRSHKYLPVPAYLCKKGGVVTVIVSVDNSGDVIQYNIDESATNTQNDCLRQEAIAHARISEFRAMSEAPKKHVGSITYTFEKQ